MQEFWWVIVPTHGHVEPAFWTDIETAMQRAYEMGAAGGAFSRLYFWTGGGWTEVRFPFLEHPNPTGQYPEGW